MLHWDGGLAGRAAGSRGELRLHSDHDHTLRELLVGGRGHHVRLTSTWFEAREFGALMASSVLRNTLVAARRELDLLATSASRPARRVGGTLQRAT